MLCKCFIYGVFVKMNRKLGVKVIYVVMVVVSKFIVNGVKGVGFC